VKKRTCISQHTGSALVAIAAAAANVKVVAEERGDTQITVSATGDADRNAFMVDEALVDESGDRIALVVPVRPGTPVSTGQLEIEGMIHNLAVLAAARLAGAAPVDVEVRTPLRSSITVHLGYGAVHADGLIEAAHVRTREGDIDFGDVEIVALHADSGDVQVRGLGDGGGSIAAAAGAITVTARHSCSLIASTIDGDITIDGAPIRLQASSRTGSVRAGSL